MEIDVAFRDSGRHPRHSVLAWPGKTLLVAAIFFGVYLLITGIAQVIFAFSLDVSAGGRVLLFISGAAALILAVLCFRSLQESILLLAIWIGVGFIFRGVATAVSAISDPTLPGRGWEIFIGVVSLLAGIYMLAWPFESIATLTLVVGIWLIVIGVFEIVSAFVHPKGRQEGRARPRGNPRRDPRGKLSAHTGRGCYYTVS